jgi:hypothetical protein
MKKYLLWFLLILINVPSSSTAQPTLWQSIASRKFTKSRGHHSHNASQKGSGGAQKAESYSHLLTPGGGFRIAYPSRFGKNLRPIDLLANALLDAEKKLEKLGFRFSSLSRPIEVAVVPPDKLSSPKLLAEEENAYKLFTNNYPKIKVNEKKLLENAGNEDLIRAVIGHEFFHAVQNLYDPAWFDSKHALFLAEMSSVWFEHKMVRNPTGYLPSVAKDYANFTNYGLDNPKPGKSGGIWKAPNAYAVDTRARLGYGASSFLRYLTLYFNDDGIVYEIWKEFKGGKKATEAIDTVIRAHSGTKIGAGIGRVWRSFVKDYYNRFSLNPRIKEAANFPKPEENAIVNLEHTKNFSKSFTLPPYSAVSLFLGVKGDLREPMEMNITIGGLATASLFSARDGKELVYALRALGKVNSFSLPYRKRYKSFKLLLINDYSYEEKIRLKIAVGVKKKRKRGWASAAWIESASVEDLIGRFCPRPQTKGNGIRHIVTNTMKDPIHSDYYIDESRGRLNIGPHLSKWGETITLSCYDIVNGKNVQTDGFTIQWHVIENRDGTVKRGYFVDFERHWDSQGRRHGPYRKWSMTELFLDAMYDHGELTGCKSSRPDKDSCAELP